MSLLADALCVKRLSFGHATPQEALADVSVSPDLADDAGDFEPLVRRLQQYAEGIEDDFLDVEIDCAVSTPFQRRVVDLCRRIPYGSSLTYGELAERAGHPRAARAVGNCMRTNRVPLIVPCHRVVGTAGALRGYSAGEGIRMKLRLLEMESAAAGSHTAFDRGTAGTFTPGTGQRSARLHARQSRARCRDREHPW
jgi:methylated-DNA-[protein]-cysteine S-methyltransferase